MSNPPQTSSLPPLPFLLAQSAKSLSPSATQALGPKAAPRRSPLSGSQSLSSKSPKRITFPLPKLRLEIRDLNHDGAQTFLSSVIASRVLETAVQSVLSLLYVSPDSSLTTVPGTRSVTLILRSMPGVAYTTASDLDSDHKEIHFSLDYIQNSIPQIRKHHEILGVLTHEMVHCYQYNGFGTCPGGLIEGIADWVRLTADLSPPHWKKDATGKWDAGYQHTGYFLEYLEQRFGSGTVRKLNEKLRIEKYEEKRFWTESLGGPVEQLWGDYCKTVGKVTTMEGEGVLVERDDASSPGYTEALPTSTVQD